MESMPQSLENMCSAEHKSGVQRICQKDHCRKLREIFYCVRALNHQAVDDSDKSYCRQIEANHESVSSHITHHITDLGNIWDKSPTEIVKDIKQARSALNTPIA